MNDASSVNYTKFLKLFKMSPYFNFTIYYMNLTHLHDVCQLCPDFGQQPSRDRIF